MVCPSMSSKEAPLGLRRKPRYLLYTIIGKTYRIMHRDVCVSIYFVWIRGIQNGRKKEWKMSLKHPICARFCGKFLWAGFESGDLYCTVHFHCLRAAHSPMCTLLQAACLCGLEDTRRLLLWMSPWISYSCQPRVFTACTFWHT